jgi:hypothetical protein
VARPHAPASLVHARLAELCHNHGRYRARPIATTARTIKSDPHFVSNVDIDRVVSCRMFAHFNYVKCTGILHNWLQKPVCLHKVVRGFCGISFLAVCVALATDGAGQKADR